MIYNLCLKVSTVRFINVSDHSGISVPGDLLEPGGTYRVTCDVTAVGYAKTPLSESYIVNWAPRDGSCNIDKYEGMYRPQ